MKLSMRYIGLTIIALLGLQESLTARAAAKSEAGSRLSMIERKVQAIKEDINDVIRCLETGCERNALTKVLNQSIAAAEASMKGISKLLGMTPGERREKREKMAAFLGSANTALVSGLKSLEKKVRALKAYANRLVTGNLSAVEKAQLLWGLKVTIVVVTGVTVVVAGVLAAKGIADSQRPPVDLPTDPVLDRFYGQPYSPEEKQIISAQSRREKFQQYLLEQERIEAEQARVDAEAARKAQIQGQQPSLMGPLYPEAPSAYSPSFEEQLEAGRGKLRSTGINPDARQESISQEEIARRKRRAAMAGSED